MIWAASKKDLSLSQSYSSSSSSLARRSGSRTYCRAAAMWSSLIWSTVAWKGAGGAALAAAEVSDRSDEMELVMARLLLLPGAGEEDRVGGPE